MARLHHTALALRALHCVKECQNSVKQCRTRALCRYIPPSHRHSPKRLTRWIVSDGLRRHYYSRRHLRILMIIQNIGGHYVALMRAPKGTQGGYIGHGRTYTQAIINAILNSKI